jgi:hypothetical protein
LFSFRKASRLSLTSSRTAVELPAAVRKTIVAMAAAKRFHIARARRGGSSG